MMNVKSQAYRQQKYQWIPQEITYSLREQSRTNSNGQSITSSTNAMLAVVLPDRSGSYSYFWSKCNLCNSNCTMYNGAPGNKPGWNVKEA